MAIELAQSAAEPFLSWEKNDGLFIYFYYYFLGFETVKWGGRGEAILWLGPLLYWLLG
jgi:hypothetical protein